MLQIWPLSRFFSHNDTLFPLFSNTSSRIVNVGYCFDHVTTIAELACKVYALHNICSAMGHLDDPYGSQAFYLLLHKTRADRNLISRRFFIFF
jgi:hypothetical protein